MKKTIARRHPSRSLLPWLIFLQALLLGTVTQAVFAGVPTSPLTFSKVFTPNTIGPGSVSTITFTITNPSGLPETGIGFTDVLPTVPGDVDIADPARASTDCDLGTSGVLSAPDGGGTITLSDARIGAFESCTITVDVTAGTPGVHTNPAVELSSDSGSTFSSPIDLTVVTTLPGFSKSFSPGSVSLGGRSTLTFTVDNSANASAVPNLDFTDNLPAGMTIAAPAVASTTCGTATLPANLIADSGTSVIVLDSDGVGAFPALAAGATCTVTVDVTTDGLGMLDNVSGELLADNVSAGKASATLEVLVTPLALQKSFTNDPVPPGGTVDLEFRIDNRDRNFAATGVAFTDDLTTALAGLTFDSLLASDCGGSVSGVGTTTISFSGGTVAPEGSCSIRVSLAVPGTATAGSYTNTTGAITGTVDGSGVIGNMASEILFVEPAPVLTKEFLEVGTLLPDPVISSSDDVVLRFTVTNTSATSGATDITFMDELTDGSGGFPPDTTSGFLPFPVSVTLPPVPDPPCGAGSSLALVSAGFERQALELTGGSLAAMGMAGDSCTFDVTLTTPAGLGPAVYTNTTEQITATVDGATRIGNAASDTLTVIAAPVLSKAFTDDPVAPGGMVAIEFTLAYPPDASGDATAITFTDDLAPVLAGLTATGLPITEACDPDGPGGITGTGTLSGSAGDTLLTFADGTLMPGESCVVSVTLDVPAVAAPGTYANTTSGVGATVEGLAAVSQAASDDLKVAGLNFTKEFLGDPAFPGETLTLRYTIDNIHPTDDATITFFTDNLAAALSSLAATGPPSLDSCGGTLSGTTFLTYVGGSVMSGMNCTIEVEVLVPAAAADGTYGSATSFLSATQGGAVTIDPAVDTLVVDANRLQLTKAFVDDPVAPGDSVTLEFNLTNLDAGLAASAIDFSDDLDAALLGLTFDSVLLDDCGGTTSGTGTTTITVTGASLAAGGSCTIQASLTVPGAAAPGVYPSTTSGVTGDIGGFAVTGDAVSDDLDVIQLLDFSKSFDGPTAATNTAILTFTIANPGPDAASGIFFSDDLGSVLPGLVASSLPSVPCGADSTITGVSFLTFTGGELAPLGGTCSFDVVVLVPAATAAGTYPNTTSELFQAGIQVAEPATTDLIIEPPPTFAKAFAPDSIGLGLNTTLTFTVDNSATAVAVDSLDFTDNLPAGLVVATPPAAASTCAGTVTAVAGSGVVSLSGGTVGAGASCTVAVDLVASATGMVVNTTGDLTSSSGNSGTASDTLTVNPQPTFAKSFAPDLIAVGGTSTLTFTVDNSASTVDATGLDFTDNLPAGLTVANPTNASVTCAGGVFTATAGTGVISYAAGSVLAGQSCTLSVDVNGGSAGIFVNLSGDLTSVLGSSGTATDTLMVDGMAPRVTGVSTVAGALATCDTVRQEVASITVSLEDDSMILNAGDAGSYQLVASGPDGDFATGACGAVAGDDVEVSILSVSLAGPSPVTATLNFNGLNSGLYRLLVCDTILDDVGNALDGDNNMVAGGDFVLPFFRVDPFNLFDNGHFDDCPVNLDPWTAASTPPNVVAAGMAGTDDVDGSPLSGSARITHSAAGATSLSQCVAVAASTRYRVSGRTRFDPAPGATALLTQDCEFYDAAGCTGAAIGTISSMRLLEDDAGGEWTITDSLLISPAGSASALCDFTVQDAGVDPNFELYLDRLIFLDGLPIFRDGFESPGVVNPMP